MKNGIKVTSDILSTLDQMLNQNEQHRLKIAKLLVTFKNDVHTDNNELRKCVYELIKVHDKKSFGRVKRDIKKLKTCLVFYISTWYIYIQQGIISTSDVKNSLGNFLDDEYLLLKDLLDYLLVNRAKIYHDDALNCKKLFQSCANIGNGGNR